MNQPLTFNKYLPVAIIYFFLNSFLLPLGLLYTTILTPLLILWLLKYPSAKYILTYFLFTLPFALFHFINGVEPVAYAKSFTLLFCAYVFGICFYQFLKVTVTLRSIFRYILIINTILIAIACFALLFPGLRDIFWMTTNVSSGLENVSRLRLLTYEPSYYATLLAPIVIYYYLKVLLLRLSNAVLMLIMVTLPLLLSFSFGILIGIPLAIGILFFVNMKHFLANRLTRRLIILCILLFFLGLVGAFILFPDNPLFVRISNILEGRDTSFSGRTYDSFYLAWELIKKKSILFGVGLGQTKLLGLELWNKFYHYKFTIDSIAIPCAVADTMACFGILGVSIRLLAELYFFYRTRVYTNYYRFALFIFIFIYQFTGSYINNIAEFAIWILAFTNTFEEFDKKGMVFNHVHHSSQIHGHNKE